MKKINFSLLKNNEHIIKENNIKCIKQNNKTTFIIKENKYTYDNNKLIKENEEEIISLDFTNKLATIYLKKYDNYLNLNILESKIDNKENFIEIMYKIETEKDYNNIIRIEYI